MDQEKIKQGVRLILEGVGEDLNREGLVETPDRVARMYEELLAGLTMDGLEHLQKTFSVENKILPFILYVSIICCRFTGKYILPMCRTEKWLA